VPQVLLLPWSVRSEDLQLISIPSSLIKTSRRNRSGSARVFKGKI